MAAARGFDFCRTKTCALVGAGASLHLGYPSFCDPAQVQAIFNEALAQGQPFQWPQHQANAQRLIDILGPHLGWNLERMYEHLAHMPPFMYGHELDCNTDHLCQWLVATVAERLSVPRGPEQLAACRQRWLEAASHLDRPVALFTTNYDSVLEYVLADVGFADGWEDGHYSRRHFAAQPSHEYALVKLHGSAGWWRAKQGTSLEVIRSPRVCDESLSRPACLPPFRRKWATEEPYSSGYDFLQDALTAADELLVVGFSWRDLSATTVLRGALADRGAGHPLTVHAFDTEPYAVEERVRLFLHESGASHLVPRLRWQHHRGRFPELPLVGAGETRAELTDEVSLLDRGEWAVLWGEPPGVAQIDGAGRVLVRWHSGVRYFESGRVILLRSLPPHFHIDVHMTALRYGAGWDPGMALEDDQCNEVLAARFVPGGHRQWHRADDGEPDANGLRVTCGLGYVHRDPIGEGAEVTIRVTGSPDETHVECLVHGQLVSEHTASHPPGRRPTRLQLGCFPWYSDDPGSRPDAECVIGPCTVRPV